MFALPPEPLRHIPARTCGSHLECTDKAPPRGERPGSASKSIFTSHPHPMVVFPIIRYLEGNPRGVDFGSGPRERRGSAPHAQRGGVSTVYVQQSVADGALVLITGHDEEEDDEGGKAQQQNHSSQREPIHLPILLQMKKSTLKTYTSHKSAQYCHLCPLKCVEWILSVVSEGKNIRMSQT